MVAEGAGVIAVDAQVGGDFAAACVVTNAFVTIVTSFVINAESSRGNPTEFPLGIDLDRADEVPL